MNCCAGDKFCREEDKMFLMGGGHGAFLLPSTPTVQDWLAKCPVEQELQFDMFDGVPYFPNPNRRPEIQ